LSEQQKKIINLICISHHNTYQPPNPLLKTDIHMQKISHQHFVCRTFWIHSSYIYII